MIDSKMERSITMGWTVLIEYSCSQIDLFAPLRQVFTSIHSITMMCRRPDSLVGSGVGSGEHTKRRKNEREVVTMVCCLILKPNGFLCRRINANEINSIHNIHETWETWHLFHFGKNPLNRPSNTTLHIWIPIIARPRSPRNRHYLVSSTTHPAGVFLISLLSHYSYLHRELNMTM